MIKINFDAVVDKSTWRGVVAAVARNSNGVFLSASATVYPEHSNLEMLETLTYREGVVLMCDIVGHMVKLYVIMNLSEEYRGAFPTSSIGSSKLLKVISRN
jgi:hypothetical protein